MNKEGLGVTLTLLRIPVRDWTLLRDVSDVTEGSTNYCGNSISGEQGGGHTMVSLTCRVVHQEEVSEIILSNTFFFQGMKLTPGAE